MKSVYMHVAYLIFDNSYLYQKRLIWSQVDYKVFHHVQQKIYNIVSPMKNMIFNQLNEKSPLREK